LITQDLASIPFDFKHLRHYDYDNTIDGFKKLQGRLPEVIRDLYREA
jgi:hypothetical protein